MQSKKEQDQYKKWKKHQIKINNKKKSTIKVYMNKNKEQSLSEEQNEESRIIHTNHVHKKNLKYTSKSKLNKKPT